MGRSRRSQQSNISPTAQRVRMTFIFVTFLLVAIPALFVIDGGRKLLMPGPLTSGHSAIAECQVCHTANGSEQMSWLDGLTARNPHNDSVACLECHNINGRIAFYPHTATPQMLNSNLEHLKSVASGLPKPQTAYLRDIAFPMKGVLNNELNCATCHEEHKGATFDITAISDARCQSCHTVQFNSFDGNHPEFSNYPFKRRQRLKFNHTSHITKHYPEVSSKNEPGRRIPNTCSDCHDSANRKQMALQSFNSVCSSCHLDQITGAERATGPKGIAFLSLPGVDLQTLQEKGISIGEWPEFSEAELSPFMALMISQKPEGAAALAQLKDVDLLDLSSASDQQVNAASQLVWQIKDLIYTLLSGKASDVLAGLNALQGTQVNPVLIADLSANLPRDVIINAQIEWLPNLASEIQQRRASLDDLQKVDWRFAMAEQKLSASAVIDTIEFPASLPVISREAVETGRPRIAQAATGGSDKFTIDAEGRLIEAPSGSGQASPSSAGGAQNVDDDLWTIDADGRLVKRSSGQAGNANNAQDAAISPVDDQNGSVVPADANVDAASDAIDDTGADSADVGSDLDDTPVAANASSNFASIESSVDTESWAEYGGWYRRDFTIFYRPAGHKDKFIYAWLNMTAPFVSNGGAASKIFSRLTQKDAQGQCAKCHSFDIRNDGGFTVNWSPSSLADKNFRFTKFVHEPHFAVLENDGCLTCHNLDRQANFEKTYEQNDPNVPSANFSKVKKELCIKCHGSGNARQDCLLCHEYHVQDIVTPILRTQLPRQ